MAQRNKPAQRVKTKCDLTNDLDDWLEPNDVVVCSSANCGKISLSSIQLDVLLQDDHCSSSRPPSRYNPLSFINANSGQHSDCSNRNRTAAVIVDCREDEQFVAYGSSKSDHQQHQPCCTTSVSKCTSTPQYIMSVSSSLPAVTSISLDDSHHPTNKKSCDPITVISDDQDEDLHMLTPSGHVMSGDSSDPTTTQRNSSIKRKRRKLLHSKCLVSNWQPAPINVEGEQSSSEHAVITTSKQHSTTTSNSSPVTINSPNTFNFSPITLEEHSSHEHATTKSCGSSTACDITEVEESGSPTILCNRTEKHVVAMVTNDTASSDERQPAKNKLSLVNTRISSASQSFTRPPLTSVKATRTFYNQNSNRLYGFNFTKYKKTRPKPEPVFALQNRLKNYKIPHKSQSSQHMEMTSVPSDDDDNKKKSHQLSLTAALSMIDKPTNASKCSNNKHFEETGASLSRRSLNKQQQNRVSNRTTMLTSVHLDCSKANVGTLTGIAEGATLCEESLTFELNDGGPKPHLIVITPLVNAVKCCKINLQQQPYIIQLLLFNGPAKLLNRKVKLNSRIYDPESSDKGLRFVQLLFDLKPSSESCEAINKILDTICTTSSIGWTVERDTISSDDIYDPSTTPASSNKRLTLKSYETRSKLLMTSPPLQAIKDNYTISDDDDDDVNKDDDDDVNKVDDDNVNKVDDDDDFDLTTNTTKTFRRSTRSSSVTRVKPKDDKLLLSYRPGTLARAVSIFLSDLDCLHEGEFLNDKIIDFYLKYLWYDKLPDDSSRNRVHVFSPFFYTRLVNSSFGGGKKGNQFDPELLHSRVKNWTKNVDLFSKELVILPVCQSSHWYVAVICQAGLFEATSSSSSAVSSTSLLNSMVITGSESSDDVIAGVLDDESSSSVATEPSVVTAQTDYHDNSNIINKSLRPCILILDSLGGRPRTATTAKIRKYLTAEWKHKHKEMAEKDFSTFKVLSSSKLKVPLQENSSDCGLFVLQYVETLLQRIIIENRSIPDTSTDWFTLADISKKRNNLHELITRLSTVPGVT